MLPTCNFWVIGIFLGVWKHSAERDFHSHFLGDSLVQRALLRQVKCKARGLGGGRCMTQLFTHSWSRGSWYVEIDVSRRASTSGRALERVPTGTAVALGLCVCRHRTYMETVSSVNSLAECGTSQQGAGVSFRGDSFCLPLRNHPSRIESSHPEVFLPRLSVVSAIDGSWDRPGTQ